MTRKLEPHPQILWVVLLLFGPHIFPGVLGTPIRSSNNVAPLTGPATRAAMATGYVYDVPLINHAPTMVRLPSSSKVGLTSPKRSPLQYGINYRGRDVVDTDDDPQYQQQELVFSPGSVDELRVRPDGSSYYPQMVAADMRAQRHNVANKRGRMDRTNEAEVEQGQGSQPEPIETGSVSVPDVTLVEVSTLNPEMATEITQSDITNEYQVDFSDGDGGENPNQGLQEEAGELKLRREAVSTATETVAGEKDTDKIEIGVSEGGGNITVQENSTTAGMAVEENVKLPVQAETIATETLKVGPGTNVDDKSTGSNAPLPLPPTSVLTAEITVPEVKVDDTGSLEGKRDVAKETLTNPTTSTTILETTTGGVITVLSTEDTTSAQPKVAAKRSVLPGTEIADAGPVGGDAKTLGNSPVVPLPGATGSILASIPIAAAATNEAAGREALNKKLMKGSTFKEPEVGDGKTKVAAGALVDGKKQDAEEKEDRGSEEDDVGIKVSPRQQNVSEVADPEGVPKVAPEFSIEGKSIANPVGTPTGKTEVETKNEDDEDDPQSQDEAGEDGEEDEDNEEEEEDDDEKEQASGDQRDSPAEFIFGGHGKHSQTPKHGRRRRSTVTNEVSNDDSRQQVPVNEANVPHSRRRYKRFTIDGMSPGMQEIVPFNGRRAFVDTPVLRQRPNRLAVRRRVRQLDGDDNIRRPRQTVREFVNFGPNHIRDKKFPRKFCELDRDSGHICPGIRRGIYMEQFYYLSDSNRCSHFVYNGCGGNANRFASLWECTQSCGRPRLGENNIDDLLFTSVNSSN